MANSFRAQTRGIHEHKPNDIRLLSNEGQILCGKILPQDWENNEVNDSHIFTHPVLQVRFPHLIGFIICSAFNSLKEKQ